jgi:hypothetical protein
MFRKLFLIAGAALILASASTVARADSFTLTGINTGVTATVNITQLNNNQIGFTITNTSTGAVTGKITSIGFNLPGGGGAYTLQSATNPNYTIALNVAGNASGINTTFEFALLTGPNFNGGGNPNQGIIEGASATFIVTGDFSGMSQQLIAQGIFLRFQDVNAAGGSDVARCVNCGNPIPEPTTMVLLGTGLAGLAAKVRRRKKANGNSEPDGI